MANSADRVKITMDLPPRVWEKLTRLAAEQDCSRTEMVRRCISTEFWRWTEVVQAGGRLVVVLDDGVLERVQFPWDGR